MIATSTLYQYLPLEQGSPEWLAFRNNGIGSSDAPTLVEANPYGDSWRKLYDRKTGAAPELYAHPGMVKGRDLEPLARAWYERHSGRTWEPAVVVSNRYPWAFASLDGHDSDEDCEYKTYVYGSEEHETYRLGEVPPYDYWQAQHRFLVRGARVCHCVLYEPKYGIVPEGGIVVDVEPNPEHMAALLEAEKRFIQHLETGEEPALTDRDEVYIFEPEAIKLAQQYKEWAEAEKSAKNEKDALREKLQAIVQRTHPRIRFGDTGVLATFTVPAKAPIDYKAVVRDFMASDERVMRYQKPVKATLRIYCPGESNGTE